MRELLVSIDGILRGNYTRREDLAAGRIAVPAARLLLLGLILGAVYGACMGLYALMRGGPGGAAQVIASALKVPLLFLLTLCVTFPSLYVFSALFGSRLRAELLLRLLLLAIAVNLAVLASLGPVTAFFTLSTESYPFMKLLNVVVFAIAGFIGLGFLRRAIAAVFEGAATPPAMTTAAPADPALAAPAPSPAVTAADVVAREERLRVLFRVWLVLYGIVGAQMGWILRPFIGAPSLPFEAFRVRESNFFQACWRTLVELFGG